MNGRRPYRNRKKEDGVMKSKIMNLMTIFIALSVLCILSSPAGAGPKTPVSPSIVKPSVRGIPNVVVDKIFVKHVVPGKPDSPIDLKIYFMNKGNAPSSPELKYTVSCTTLSGGPECPIASSTLKMGVSIPPHKLHGVTLGGITSPKPGKYQVAVFVPAGSSQFKSKKFTVENPNPVESQITGITLSPRNTVLKGTTVKVTINGKGKCKVVIGSQAFDPSPQVLSIGPLPRTYTFQANKAGKFKIAVFGSDEMGKSCVKNPSANNLMLSTELHVLEKIRVVPKSKK